MGAGGDREAEGRPLVEIVLGRLSGVVGRPNQLRLIGCIIYLLSNIFIFIKFYEPNSIRKINENFSLKWSLETPKVVLVTILDVRKILETDSSTWPRRVTRRAPWSLGPCPAWLHGLVVDSARSSLPDRDPKGNVRCIGELSYLQKGLAKKQYKHVERVKNIDCDCNGSNCDTDYWWALL